MSGPRRCRGGRRQSPGQNRRDRLQLLFPPLWEAGRPGPESPGIPPSRKQLPVVVAASGRTDCRAPGSAEALDSVDSGWRSSAPEPPDSRHSGSGSAIASAAGLAGPSSAAPRPRSRILAELVPALAAVGRPRQPAHAQEQPPERAPHQPSRGGVLVVIRFRSRERRGLASIGLVHDSLVHRTEPFCGPLLRDTIRGVVAGFGVFLHGRRCAFRRRYDGSFSGNLLLRQGINTRRCWPAIDGNPERHCRGGRESRPQHHQPFSNRRTRARGGDGRRPEHYREHLLTAPGRRPVCASAIERSGASSVPSVQAAIVSASRHASARFSAIGVCRSHCSTA